MCTQKPYLDHFFVNAEMSVRVEIRDIEVGTRSRGPLCLLVLRNPRIRSAALVTEPAAAAAPARSSSSQLAAVTNSSVEEAIVECGITNSGAAAAVTAAGGLKHLAERRKIEYVERA